MKLYQQALSELAYQSKDNQKNEMEKNLISDASNLKSVMYEQRRLRKVIFSTLNRILLDEELNEALVKEFNYQVADYMTLSQFSLLPHLSSKLAEHDVKFFIDNSVGFSYITNLVHDHANSRSLFSVLTELLAERFMREDKVIGAL